MSDDAQTRGGATDGRERRRGSTTDRWITDSPVPAAELPDDVQATLGRILGEEPVETLEDWITAVRRRTGGGAITVDNLCHASEATGHRGVMDGETYRFRCFYDAVILSALAETPVDIRTESPEGTVIEARAAGTTDLTVTPEAAVFSFGASETAEPPSDREPSPADIYAAVCPYVRAFPNPDAYERWERTVPAATVAMPLAGATDVAAGLVE